MHKTAGTIGGGDEQSWCHFPEGKDDETRQLIPVQPSDKFSRMAAHAARLLSLYVMRPAQAARRDDAKRAQRDKATAAERLKEAKAAAARAADEAAASASAASAADGHEVSPQKAAGTQIAC